MKKSFAGFFMLLIMFALFVPNVVKAQTSTKPISILLLGIDTGADGRTETGRSDVIIVATVNPHSKKVTLTSIPRDTYTEIVGYGINDKINHAYAFGGPKMIVDSVNNLFQIELDYYVAINMGGLAQLVDALDGVEVIPPASFQMSGFQFNEGEKTILTGEMAVAYARERYNSGGDYGRQERQREIIQSIFNKLSSTDSVINVVEILKMLGTNVETNLSLVQIVKLVNDYRNQIVNFETYQLTGNGQMIEGIWYDILDSTELSETIERLNGELQE